MHTHKVLYADSSFDDLSDFERSLTSVDANVVHGNCKTPEDVIGSGSDAVCIITELIPLNEMVFQKCPSLKLVYTNNVGTDLIDIPAATRHGILVCNNPDYNFREVAEHTVALLLSLIRKIPKANGYVRSGGYDYNYLVPERKISVYRESLAAEVQSLNYCRSNRWGIVVNRILSLFSPKFELPLH